MGHSGHLRGDWAPCGLCAPDMCIRRLLLVVGVLSALATVRAQHQSRLVFQVEPRSQECFFLESGPEEKDKKMALELAVVRGGLLDILVEVWDPAQSKIFSHMYFEGKGDNVIEFVTASEGDYKICFNNQMARWTPKVVSFQLSPATSDSQPLAADDITPSAKSVDAITGLFEKVLKEQTHLKDREAVHSATLESTYIRITYFSIFESSVLILLAMVQVYFVKSWFSQPSRQGMV